MPVDNADGELDQLHSARIPLTSPCDMTVHQLYSGTERVQQRSQQSTATAPAKELNSGWSKIDLVGPSASLPVDHFGICWATSTTIDWPPTRHFTNGFDLWSD